MIVPVSVTSARAPATRVVTAAPAGIRVVSQSSAYSGAPVDPQFPPHAIAVISVVPSTTATATFAGSFVVNPAAPQPVAADSAVTVWVAARAVDAEAGDGDGTDAS